MYIGTVCLRKKTLLLFTSWCVHLTLDNIRHRKAISKRTVNFYWDTLYYWYSRSLHGAKFFSIFGNWTTSLGGGGGERRKDKESLTPSQRAAMAASFPWERKQLSLFPHGIQLGAKPCLLSHIRTNKPGGCQVRKRERERERRRRGKNGLTLLTMFFFLLLLLRSSFQFPAFAFFLSTAAVRSW